MRFFQLLTALLVGGLLGFGSANYFTRSNTTNSVTSLVKWTWPDSLDAVKAAPENHKIVYKDSNVRILQVLLNGHKEEPIHTHRYRSIMWITKPAVPCTIYQYALNKGGGFYATDSVTVPHMQTNIGFPNDAEGPTGIKNLGSDNGIAYRVEFKKEFQL